MRYLSLFAAFILGACAGTVLHTRAQQPGVSPNSPKRPATIVQLADAEHRQVGAGKAHIRFLARGYNAFIGKLEMAAGGKVPLHADSTEEYVHVLAGNGRITIDGQESAIGPGDTIFMPANAKVSYRNGDAAMVALQVFAGPAPAAKYKRWQVVR